MDRLDTGRITRRRLLQAGAAAAVPVGVPMAPGAPERVPDRTVVLTFDDAVKSHRTFVGPLLKELGFGATFFVTHQWMADRQNFMTWDEIAELHRMGFEIGNHSWTHANFGSPRNAARLEGELALVEYMLSQVGVPRPETFAYCANAFGPEAVTKLDGLGFRLARRGAQPEAPYGKVVVGSAYDPKRHHPLLVPTTGDSYPDWTFEHFKKVVAQARDGKIAVLQFHGVPDVAHPWVHTPPERFREYLAYLKERGYRVLALRDLARYVDWRRLPEDPLLTARFPEPMDGKVALPVEVEQTRRDLNRWVEEMVRDHGYSPVEVAEVTGLPTAAVSTWVETLRGKSTAPREADGRVRVLRYPGGRHPRLGFRNGEIDPLRGTKVSLRLPWEGAGYAVLDLPEAVFSNLGLAFLAHTHIPTVWDEQNVVIQNRDWQPGPGGSWTNSWTLPNKVRISTEIAGETDGARLRLGLHNGTDQPLTGLRTQVCLMLGAAPGFDSQTNDNKRFRQPVAVARNREGSRWILLALERCGRAWGNAPCPCLHSDPVLPDCPPGETVSVRGRIRFYEGTDVEAAIERLMEPGKDIP